MVREEIFSTIGVNFAEVHDLQGFENFVYGNGDRVIRITHDSHRTLGHLWMRPYAVIHAHVDPGEPDGWFPRKFMHGGCERIEQAKPYVDLDFSRY